MDTKVHKIGNSLSVYIPKKFAEKTGLLKGTSVFLRSIGRKIIIEPQSKKETLHDLLKNVTPLNIRPLIDFGPDVGREIIS